MYASKAMARFSTNNWKSVNWIKVPSLVLRKYFSGHARSYLPENTQWFNLH